MAVMNLMMRVYGVRKMSKQLIFITMVRIKKLFEEVVYTYVWRTKLSKIIIWLKLVIPPMTKRVETQFFVECMLVSI